MSNDFTKKQQLMYLFSTSVCLTKLEQKRGVIVKLFEIIASIFHFYHTNHRYADEHYLINCDNF